MAAATGNRALASRCALDAACICGSCPREENPRRRNSWSDIHPDLLVLILKRLALVDYIRFGAVCTAWNLVFEQRLCRPAPQVPWLMFSAGDDAGDGWGGCDARNFLDISTGRTHTLHLPELHGRQCIGTSEDGGWVVYIDEDLELGLLHLATRQRLPLPLLSTIWTVKDVIRDSRGRAVEYSVKFNKFPGDVSFTPTEMLHQFFHKAKVLPLAARGHSSHPIVLFQHAGGSATVSIARPGDEAWTRLEGCPFGIRDAVIHGGRLCVVDLYGEAVAWDLCEEPSQASTRTLARSGPVPLGPPFERHLHEKYLVSAGAGDLFLVCRKVEFTGDLEHSAAYGTFAVRVFKFDPAAGDRWLEVRSLDDRAFFLGHNYGVVLPSGEEREEEEQIAAIPAGLMIRKNCIYFTDHKMRLTLMCEENRRGDRDMGVFSLEDGSWERLPLPAGAVTYPSPIWATPSLFF